MPMVHRIFRLRSLALQELAIEMSTPICGSDFKTGQTFMKTVVAPGLRNRLLGVSGWYSTNILGNRDGEVLDDPGSFKSKEVSKTGVFENIFFQAKNILIFIKIFHMSSELTIIHHVAIIKKAGIISTSLDG